MSYVWHSVHPTSAGMLDELAMWWITGDGQNDPEEALQHLRNSPPDDLADELIEVMGDDIVPHMVEYDWDGCDLADAFDRLKRSWLTEYKHESVSR